MDRDESTEPPQVVKEMVFKNAQAATKKRGRSRGDGPPAHFVESPGRPGIFAAPEAVENWKDLVSGRLQEVETEENDPEVKALAAELRQVRLPDDVRDGRVVAKADVITIYGSERLARYLVKDRGVRVHPELEKRRWVATPGKVNSGGIHDSGTYVERNEDGTWPITDPESYFDMDKIESAQDPETGEWVASHPSGVVARGPSKISAQTKAANMLLERVDIVREAQEKEASQGGLGGGLV